MDNKELDALEELAARIKEANCRPIEVSTLAAPAILELIALARAVSAAPTAAEGPSADVVTRESALSAIRHAAESREPGKTIRAAHMLAAAPLPTKEGAGKVDAWISVEDRLPDQECLAVYVTPNGKQRLIRAKYARQFQIEAEGDDCETEYNEDDDTLYIKAGWLECVDNWGEYSSCYVVEGTVTHWKPSPALPAIAAQPKDTTKGQA